SRAKILGMLLGSSCCHHPCIDKCFDPRDVCVSVKDGKVTVSAEHKDECNTGLSKSCSYKRYTKEFSLPPGEEEVTYS
ncbi:ODFP1 protein, partial [Leucopsar rothschildi]|nr:ODFP1 protein [Leucopsar rothschildi]